MFVWLFRGSWNISEWLKRLTEFSQNTFMKVTKLERLDEKKTKKNWDENQQKQREM